MLFCETSSPGALILDGPSCAIIIDQEYSVDHKPILPLSLTHPVIFPSARVSSSLNDVFWSVCISASPTVCGNREYMAAQPNAVYILGDELSVDGIGDILMSFDQRTEIEATYRSYNLKGYILLLYCLFTFWCNKDVVGLIVYTILNKCITVYTEIWQQNCFQHW